MLNNDIDNEINVLSEEEIPISVFIVLGLLVSSYLIFQFLFGGLYE